MGASGLGTRLMIWHVHVIIRFLIPACTLTFYLRPNDPTYDSLLWKVSAFSFERFDSPPPMFESTIILIIACMQVRDLEGLVVMLFGEVTKDNEVQIKK
jgi:hypothetical protein